MNKKMKQIKAKQVYNTNIDELLLRGSKGIKHYNQDDKENIYLESLKQDTSLFDLARNTGRSGMTLLNILAPQYPDTPKKRLPKHEVAQVLEELKTKSIRYICETHNINPKNIKYMLMARMYYPGKEKITRTGWTEEMNDYVFKTSQEIYEENELDGHGRRMSNKAMENMRKELNRRFNTNKTFFAVRTRTSDLNTKRNSLSNLIRSKPTNEKVVAKNTPTSSQNAKDFQEWVKTRGLELYLQEKADALEKLKQDLQGSI